MKTPKERKIIATWCGENAPTLHIVNSAELAEAFRDGHTAMGEDVGGASDECSLTVYPDDVEGEWDAWEDVWPPACVREAIAAKWEALRVAEEVGP